MHRHIMKLAYKLWRQIRIIGDLRLHFLVCWCCYLQQKFTKKITTVKKGEIFEYWKYWQRIIGGLSLTAELEEDIGFFTGMVSLCTNLLAVALREVHNPATHRGQGNKRTGTGMPQLRVQTLVLLHSCNGRSICFALRTSFNTASFFRNEISRENELVTYAYAN